MSLPKSKPPRVAAKAGQAAETASKITIGEMARLFDVSLRTLRFYEDRGLLIPRREGLSRFYAERDKARLESILRCKHLGFTLTEIRDMIAEADKRPASPHLKLRSEQVLAQIAHLERQRRNIDGAIAELRNVQRSLERA